MDKIDDMSLFVQVVKSGGLAAAGRVVGLSPASMTARVNRMEERYGARLLNRSTRSISLTADGSEFHKSCQRVVEEISYIESKLKEKGGQLAGTLRITAPSDFGRQYVAPAIAEFTALHSAVRPYLYLTDGVVDLVADGFDLGIRYGNLPDSSLIVRPLDRDNRRILCASPGYLRDSGLPVHPLDLKDRRCLVLEHLGRPQDEWYFNGGDDGDISLKVEASLTANDGALIRQWALSGCGIALKARHDIREDLKAGRLVPVLADFGVRLGRPGRETVGLQLLYPSRRFQPRQARAFIDHFDRYLSERAG